MFARTHAHLHACTQTHARTHTHKHAHMRMRTRTRTRTRAHTHRGEVWHRREGSYEQERAEEGCACSPTPPKGAGTDINKLEKGESRWFNLLTRGAPSPSCSPTQLQAPVRNHPTPTLHPSHADSPAAGSDGGRRAPGGGGSAWVHGIWRRGER